MDWSMTNLGDGITRLALSGRMDVQGALAVDSVFNKVAEEYKNVVIDMAEVSYLASLGIRVLVVTCKALAAKGGNLVILSPQPTVEKVLRVSGVDGILPIAADDVAARAILLR